MAKAISYLQNTIFITQSSLCNNLHNTNSSSQNATDYLPHHKMPQIIVLLHWVTTLFIKIVQTKIVATKYLLLIILPS